MANRIFLDLTLSIMKQGQPALGIIRVEREITKSLLRSGLEVGFFAYGDADDRFHHIERSQAALLNDYIDPFSHYTTPSCVNEASFAPRSGDIIIAAGTLWVFNYLKHINTAKSFRTITFIAVIYDIIPLVCPEFTNPHAQQTFQRYIADLSAITDMVYCISDSTSRDLTRYLSQNAMRLPTLQRLVLGSDIVQKSPDYLSPLHQQVKPGAFVLCVCTLEPRKNHALLFNVWRTLYETDRENLVPLVLVGKLGWNSKDLVNMIGQSNRLYPEHIKIFCDVADEDLAWLYTNCLFSVYPSYYEGWGLPIAESLAYGKVCIASDSSSMNEVGPGLAELIDPLDQLGWIQRIRQYLRHPEYLKDRENIIKSVYTAPNWHDSMQEFVASLPLDNS